MRRKLTKPERKEIKSIICGIRKGRFLSPSSALIRAEVEKRFSQWRWDRRGWHMRWTDCAENGHDVTQFRWSRIWLPENAASYKSKLATIYLKLAKADIEL